MRVFKFSSLDFFLVILGLLLLVGDVGLDIWAGVSFYQEKDYVSLGFLLLFLLGSSVLVQTFSWLWYSYDGFQGVTKVERSLSPRHLKLLHFLQLGIYLRHAGVVELSTGCSHEKTENQENYAVYLTHDVSMLRLLEAFAESCPQLVLMLVIMIRLGDTRPWTVMKALASASAIALSVTMYHRSLRSFLPDKMKQKVTSSLMFFSWNLLLISARVFSLALFASALPCFIFSHFLSSWLVLFFFAWRSRTDFMQSAGGEWLFRATVGLIWYFSWFNVSEGRTRTRTAFYHGWMLLDVLLLSGLWCWRTLAEENHPTALYVALIAGVDVVVYLLGLVLKILYYEYHHPNLRQDELLGQDTWDVPDGLLDPVTDTVDPESPSVMMRSGGPGPPTPAPGNHNQRMRKLAKNFYA